MIQSEFARESCKLSHWGRGLGQGEISSGALEGIVSYATLL